MLESPCARCGDMTQHTDDDECPLCEDCTLAAQWESILNEVLAGSLVIPPVLKNEDGSNGP